MNPYTGIQDDREKIEIYVSCRSLKDMDTFSKSDPQVIMYTKGKNQKNWVEFGRTEIIWDDLNPNFVKTFKIDYIFEIQQHIKFDVIDIDGKTSFDFIGEAFSNIGAMVGAKNQTLILDLHDRSNKTSGKIILRADKVKHSTEEIIMKFSAKKIKNTHLLFFYHTSSPFLKFYRSKGENQNADYLVYQTEYVYNNENPFWKEFTLNLGKLCNGDRLLPIRIECWDFRKRGDHKFIGKCTITIKEVEENFVKSLNFELRDGKEIVGSLRLEKYRIENKPEFLDFLRGGSQLALMVAVDFTASNGFANRHDSLHSYTNPNDNQYIKAIQSVGEILLNYDYDKLVPLYGFGGKPRLPTLNSQNQTLHCFPLNGNQQNPDVYQLNGILQTYYNAIQNTELSGPTYFAPILSEVMKTCSHMKENEPDNYLVLLILTDGEIHDMEQTKKLIVESSHLPLSIIIVGIGNADFTNMDILDGDEGLWDSKGRKALRDLVQFVPFNKFAGDSYTLASNVLEELPTQLTEYMKFIKKLPNKPQEIDVNNIDVMQNQNYENVPFVAVPLNNPIYPQQVNNDVMNQIQNQNQFINQQPQQNYNYNPNFYSQPPQKYGQATNNFMSNLSKGKFIQQNVQNQGYNDQINYPPQQFPNQNNYYPSK